MNNYEKRTVRARDAAVPAGALNYDFDCIVDLRSTHYEHWTYNYGVISQAIEFRSTKSTRIRVTKALSQLLNRNDIPARARYECPLTFGGRLLSLMMREFLSVFELIMALVLTKRILILHGHPLGLFLASPILAFWGNRVSICLHNDLITALREDSLELKLERWLWWWVSRTARGLTFVSPNKYYSQFIRKFLPLGASIAIWPHPIIPRAVYEQVAMKDTNTLFPHASAGFFGRVERDRGISAFESHIKRHTDRVYIVAGRGASKFPTYANVHCYERPPTDIYCALVTQSDTLFLDLRGDVYRIGESGVFWDAVGLGVGVLYGELPRMYEKRIRQYFGPRSVRLQP